MSRPLKPGAVSADLLFAGASQVLIYRMEAGDEPYPVSEIWRALPEYAKDEKREREDTGRILAFMRNKLRMGRAWPTKLQALRDVLTAYIRRGAPLPPIGDHNADAAADLAEEEEAQPVAPSEIVHADNDFGEDLPPGALTPLKKAAERESEETRKRDRRGDRGRSAGSSPFERPEGVQQALRGLDPSKLDELSDLEQLVRVRKAIYAQMVISPGSSFRGLMFSLGEINKQIQQAQQEGGDNADLERDPVACATAILEELEEAMVILGVPAFKAKELASSCLDAANVAERPPPPPPPPPEDAPPIDAEDLPTEDSGEGW